MIVVEGATGDGRRTLVVGLDYQNLDRLRAGKPASSDATGTLVLVHAAPTLHDVVEELVGHGVLPQVALDRFREPEPGETHLWDKDRPDDVDVETGGAHGEPDAAEHRALLVKRVARAQRDLADRQRDLAELDRAGG